jgi:hypothetical protein
MNERIRELLEQAGMVKILEEHAHEYGNGTFENTPYPELEKFAELIVAEMLQTCEEHPGWTSRMIGEEIKQHFGVEE